MSVYHKWRTVFVQITKNASSAIHEALRNPSDQAHDHIDILAQNDPELVESYYSFAVVRNPYDRFVSAWEYLRNYSENRWTLSFEETVQMFYKRGRFFYTSEDLVWWPQARFISIKKIILVDKVIRYENLDNEWPEVIEEIMKRVPEGFSRPKDYLEHVNPDGVTGRNKRPWQDYYTPELKQMVYELYRRDFDLFNYPK
jgi:chondroitin 4-sulfotransferase 11